MLLPCGLLLKPVRPTTELPDTPRTTWVATVEAAVTVALLPATVTTEDHPAISPVAMTPARLTPQTMQVQVEAHAVAAASQAPLVLKGLRVALVLQADLVHPVNPATLVDLAVVLLATR